MQFDQWQAARGLCAWESADILPWGALLERMYEDALYSPLAARLPELLSPAQEHVLWERSIAASGQSVLPGSLARLAALGREAWDLAHEWAIAERMAAHAQGEEARSFVRWSSAYRSLTARKSVIERARLPELLQPLLGDSAIRKPSLLLACGFDLRTPNQAAFFAALESVGVEVLNVDPDAVASGARRLSFASAQEELRAAASWARSRLEARPQSRIGIVVPDLSARRPSVQRVLRQAMDPAAALGGSRDRGQAFNVSMGEPLAGYPLVAAALSILAMSFGEVPYVAASRLLRSPFIAGARSEADARASLDAALSGMAGSHIGLDALRRLIAKLAAGDAPVRAPPCPLLGGLLGRWAQFRSGELSSLKSAGQWARTIFELLKAVGHPGERALDSAEYQTLSKWHEALSQFGTLERLGGRMRFAEACRQLGRIARETLFQPEAPEAPIQVLGVLESGGLAFDHLWVSGLTEETWPLRSSPNPLLPIALQRAAGVPQASAARSLELDRTITRHWLGCATEVVFSYPRREEDRELAPSPLIAAVPEELFDTLRVPAYESLPEAMRRARHMETVEDPGPPLSRNSPRPVPVSGGTAVFRDQAACPFRAFARHRLGAESLEHPVPGLDSRDRGTLVHAMLAKLWSGLKSRATLEAASERDLQAMLQRSAETAINRLRWFRPEALNGRFALLEQARLVALGAGWLAQERLRPAFEVAAIEEKHALAFGGVSVNARIDRMDRIGNGEASHHIIIDYKTGRFSLEDWFGERPGDPQLPLYAAVRGGTLSGIAFAHVRAGDMGFRGIAREPGLIPGVVRAEERAMRSWGDLLAEWRACFERLGHEFAEGEARIEPREGEKTCRRCELRPLCRINERVFVPLEPQAEDET